MIDDIGSFDNRESLENHMKNDNLLCQMDCFKGVGNDSLNLLWKKGKVVTYKKNQTIFRAKETVQNIYVLLSGKTIIYNLTHAGKRKILFIFGKGTLLNEHVFDDHVTSFYCEAIENCTVFVIQMEVFMECMKKDFLLIKSVLNAQERKMWRLGHQLKNTVGSIYMERKLAAKLWKLARDFGIERPEGIEIDINMTITFLADMLGAPRETTSKTCKALSDYGLISMKKKRITIVDPARVSHFYKTGEIQQKKNDK